MQKDELIKNLMVCSGELYDGDCEHCSLNGLYDYKTTGTACYDVLMKEAGETIYNIFGIIKKLYKV